MSNSLAKAATHFLLCLPQIGTDHTWWWQYYSVLWGPVMSPILWPAPLHVSYHAFLTHKSHMMNTTLFCIVESGDVSKFLTKVTTHFLSCLLTHKSHEIITPLFRIVEWGDVSNSEKSHYTFLIMRTWHTNHTWWWLRYSVLWGRVMSPILWPEPLHISWPSQGFANKASLKFDKKAKVKQNLYWIVPTLPNIQRLVLRSRIKSYCECGYFSRGQNVVKSWSICSCGSNFQDTNTLLMSQGCYMYWHLTNKSENFPYGKIFSKKASCALIQNSYIRTGKQDNSEKG